MANSRPKPKPINGDERFSGMHLYLMRHSIAIDREDPESPEEFKRYLTPKGIERTRAAAQGLARLGVQPAALLSSPYVRAMQTGEIVCEALGIDPKKIAVTDSLLPDAEPTLLAEELEKFSEQEVMCFGHAPHVDEFIAYAMRVDAAFTEL